MGFKVIVSSRAQKELVKGIDYYALNSNDAPKNFITAVENAYSILAKDPFLRIRYKNVRALKIRRFPYLLYFVINENAQRVNILSCFHIKRNPESRPRFG